MLRILTILIVLGLFLVSCGGGGDDGGSSGGSGEAQPTSESENPQSEDTGEVVNPSTSSSEVWLDAYTFSCTSNWTNREGPLGLEATYLSNGEPAELEPGRFYSMTVSYDPGDLPPGVDETDLGLYSWNIGFNDLPGPSPDWMRETSQVDAVANAVNANPDHFSVWALLGRAEVLLPFVLR